MFQGPVSNTSDFIPTFVCNKHEKSQLSENVV